MFAAIIFIINICLRIMPHAACSFKS